MRQNTAEDYLKAIYKVYEQQEDKNRGVSSVDIASVLNVSKPSVSSAVKKLVKMGYVRSKPYSAVSLTKKGTKEAKRITHNHRVIEYFLKETLRCRIDRIHDEAHRLEHSFSDETIRKLDSFLGNPKVSPHGRRIH